MRTYVDETGHFSDTARWNPALAVPPHVASCSVVLAASVDETDSGRQAFADAGFDVVMVRCRAGHVSLDDDAVVELVPKPDIDLSIARSALDLSTPC
ncbi:hypothetical protein [Rhodococcus sp. HNM0569]|uniref:hypothetical protein n=1 Tax=Rhodococcus sp. HNM0569 TaxID=2716340 RepID=UPI00146E6D27|nr:hypothetical protein [Rhodococcus sp. HNM0569]NLU84362.1 hypothetical protein [Rhodococcus sp. HNM0569]